MNYNIINDYIVKVPYNNPYNVPRLSDVRVILSNNNLIANPKFLMPLVNTSSSITGQAPSIVRAKKSVASFKVRKGSPIGLLTTLTPQKGFGAGQGRLDNYLKLLNTYYFPKVSTTIPSNFSKNGFIVSKLAISDKKSSTLTLGVDSFSLLSYLTPLSVELLQVSYNINKLDSSQFTGGYTQFSLRFPLPKEYTGFPSIELLNNTKAMHNFYYSLLYIPFKKA